MAKGSGGTRSAGSRSAGASRATSAASMENFTPTEFKRMTGMTYSNVTENTLTDQLDTLRSIPDNTLLFTGYRAGTVRNMLKMRLNRIREEKKLNRR